MDSTMIGSSRAEAFTAYRLGGSLSPHVSEGDEIGSGLRLHDAPDRRLVNVSSQFTDGSFRDLAMRESRDMRSDEVGFEVLAGGRGRR